MVFGDPVTTREHEGPSRSPGAAAVMIVPLAVWTRYALLSFLSFGITNFLLGCIGEWSGHDPAASISAPIVVWPAAGGPAGGRVPRPRHAGHQAGRDEGAGRTGDGHRGLQRHPRDAPGPPRLPALAARGQGDRYDPRAGRHRDPGCRRPAETRRREAEAPPLGVIERQAEQSRRGITSRTRLCRPCECSQR